MNAFNVLELCQDHQQMVRAEGQETYRRLGVAALHALPRKEPHLFETLLSHGATKKLLGSISAGAVAGKDPGRELAGQVAMDCLGREAVRRICAATLLEGYGWLGRGKIIPVERFAMLLLEAPASAPNLLEFWDCWLPCLAGCSNRQLSGGCRRQYRWTW